MSNHGNVIPSSSLSSSSSSTISHTPASTMSPLSPKISSATTTTNMLILDDLTILSSHSHQSSLSSIPVVKTKYKQRCRELAQRIIDLENENKRLEDENRYLHRLHDPSSSVSSSPPPVNNIHYSS